MIEKDLRKNAVWLIMDPWKVTVDADSYTDKNVDVDRYIFLGKIIDYVKDIEHVCISCPVGMPVFDEVSHLPNMLNSPINLRHYLIQNNLNNIVYCGYAHGACIIDKPDGAAHINNLTKNMIQTEWQIIWENCRGSDWPSKCDIDDIASLPSFIKDEIVCFPELNYFAKLNIAKLVDTKYSLFVKKELSFINKGDLVDKLDLQTQLYATLI